MTSHEQIQSHGFYLLQKVEAMARNHGQKVPELAENLGISRDYFYKLKNSTAPFNLVILEALAAYLGNYRIRVTLQNINMHSDAETLPD